MRETPPRSDPGDGPRAIDSNVAYLATVLFLGNPDDQPVPFSVPELAGPEGLFLFCVDLLTRGILLTYSPRGAGECRRPPAGTVPVPLHEVSDAHFGVVARKLECAGIYVSKVSTPCATSEPQSVRLCSSSAPGVSSGDLLSGYSLAVDCRGVRHVLSFRIDRPPLGTSMCRAANGKRF